MADSYLEKKMDDLRSGRLAPAQARRGEVRKGVWCLDFPVRRVLVTDGTSALGREVMTEFSRIGCKVAFLSPNPEAGEEVALNSGARYLHCGAADSDRLNEAISGLVKAWRDVDIVINTSGGDVSHLLTLLAIHRDRLPYPNDFGGRVVDIISDGEVERNAEAVFIASRYQMTYNRIAANVEGQVVQGVAKLCVFLSSPAAGIIDGATIAV